jgi:hypothetical protein
MCGRVTAVLFGYLIVGLTAGVLRFPENSRRIKLLIYRAPDAGAYH